MKTLLVGGCSWTDANFTSAWDRSVRYKNPWPNQLATMLGDDWKVYNVALCGNNNQQIAQDIVSAIESRRVKPDLVVVMWTDWMRFSFGKHLVTPYTVFMSDETNAPLIRQINDTFGPDAYLLYKGMVDLFIKYSINISTIVERNMYTMFMLSCYLKQRGIQHYFTQGVGSINPYVFKRMVRKQFLPSKFLHFANEQNWARGILDSVYYHQLETTPNYGFPWLPSLGGDTMSDLVYTTLGKERHMITKQDRHPSEESHKLMAETIYENLY